MDERPIMGWDLGAGGGRTAKPLPAESDAIRLLETRSSFYSGAEGTRTAVLEIWGLDPRVTVALQIARVRSASLPSPEGGDPQVGNLRAEIHAYPLTRIDGQVLQGPEIPPENLWLNGGALNDAGVDDGCEITSAMHGVRVVVIASRAGESVHEIAATARARPNVSFACPALALAIRDQMVLTVKGTVF
jgi:hypothetical protein